MKLSKYFIIGLAVLLLAGCKSYNVQVDLGDEELAALQAEIKTQEEAIENFDSAEAERSFPDLETISIARAYERMGDMDKAISVYKDFMAQGYRTQALVNNLGVLYEQVGETEKAVEQYQFIMDEYFDRSYLYKITWAYIKAGERKLAEKYFNAWQLEFQTTDEETQRAIKRLREQEKEQA
jgi:pentatricopeptide repeat protein